MEGKDQFVVIFMGSKKDRGFTSGIRDVLEEFGVEYEARAISAHKAPEVALTALEEYEESEANVVYIAVAGKSNALGPILSANSVRPVINCPPLGEYKQDLYSSVRTPGGVPCSTILEPKNAGLHAVKILAVEDKELREKLSSYQQDQREAIVAADRDISFS